MYKYFCLLFGGGEVVWKTFVDLIVALPVSWFLYNHLICFIIKINIIHTTTTTVIYDTYACCLRDGDRECPKKYSHQYVLYELLYHLKCIQGETHFPVIRRYVFLVLGTHFLLLFLLLKWSYLNFRTVRKKGAVRMRVAGRGLCEMDYFVLAVAWKYSTSVNCCYLLVNTNVRNLVTVHM